MNSTRTSVFRAALWAAFSGACLFSASTMADVPGHCVPSPPCYCNQECFRCGPGGCGSSPGPSAPTIDYEAERKRQEAEAAERKRKEEEERLRKEEEFRRERDAAAGTLKGSSVSGTPELKGLTGTDSHGLKKQLEKSKQTVENITNYGTVSGSGNNSEKAKPGDDASKFRPPQKPLKIKDTPLPPLQK